MKDFITVLDDEDSALVAEDAELQKAISRAVQTVIRHFRANPAPSIMPANTVNGALGSNEAAPKKLPVPDELQCTLAANAKDSNDLCRTRS